jgi:rubrerythrin
MTREEAIAYGKRVIDLGLNDETQAFCELAIKALEQEPRKGHWIPRNAYLLRYKCSECNYKSERYNFCPNCGAKMEEVEE